MDEYQIGSGYEDGCDDDDEGRSRAIPSRTSLGREAAFVKDFPCYGGSRWGIRNYGYRCVLTTAQIALMQSDLPHTLYLKKGVRASDPALEEQRRLDEAAARRKKERQKKEGYTLEEVFNGEADIE